MIYCIGDVIGSIFLLFLSRFALAQSPPPATFPEGGAARPSEEDSTGIPTVRSILLDQLRNSHTTPHWYVPLVDALRGLTSEQAHRTDSTENHSICQIASHLLFWNERMLIAFQGNTPPPFNDDNDKTFTQRCTGNWLGTIQRLDSIQSAWEQGIANASEEQLTKWAFEVANISSHNAYHTGQIVYIRKQNGWWEASQGVK